MLTDLRERNGLTYSFLGAERFPAFYGTRRFTTPFTGVTKIHLNIILASALGLTSGYFPSGFPTKTLYAPLLCPIRATCPTHLILNFVTRIVFGEE